MALNKVNSLISKDARRQLQAYLMKEGTIVVRKDATLPVHRGTGLPNLHVMLSMRSMLSKGYVTEEYIWGYNYFVVTAEGIEYLRGELGVPAGVMPDTYASSAPAGGRRHRREPVAA